MTFPSRLLEEISQSESSEELFEIAARWLPVISRADRMSISVRLDQSNLRVAVSSGDNLIPRDTVVPIKGTIVGACFVEKETRIEKISRNSRNRFRDLHLLALRGFRLVICVPLLMKGSCFGTLKASFTEPPGDMAATVRQLETVAFWIASQISHQLKIDELVRLQNREEEREQVLAATQMAAEAARKSKSDFLATMSHEIRTPLNAILGMAGVALHTDLTKDQQDYIGIIRESGEQLLALLNDILDYSKMEAGRLLLEETSFDLRDLIHGVETLTHHRANAKGLSLQATVAEETPLYYAGDVGRIRQILLNLLSNAIKFTESGSVALAVKGIDRTNDRVTLRFTVSDTGIGIAPEVQESLFHPFVQGDASTTRAFNGTGLGLSICKELVELMGGTIGVRSMPGEGSIFHFAISLKEATKEAVNRNASTSDTNDIAAHFEQRPLRILVAEDNQVNQQVMRAILMKGGHTVDIVGNGQEAVEAVRTIPYDVVLMDVRMPELDGVAATKQIRALDGEQASIPIIGVTANAMSGDREKYLSAGMNEYVPKPIQPGRLTAALAHACHVYCPLDQAIVVDPAAEPETASAAHLEALIGDLDDTLNIGNS